MHRILLSIGCNKYEHLNHLNSAEIDAAGIFETLTDQNYGQYDRDISVKLLSPTRAELRETIIDLLRHEEQIDVFTLYFAGHGVVADGSFFMCTKDTARDFLAATAMPLSEIFQLLNSKQPLQSNIILDACGAGGLINDLGVILKSQNIGDSGTPSLTLFATSAQDEGAKETIEGGLGTSALLTFVKGSRHINDHTAALDLVDIGLAVSESMQHEIQNPIVWGLNLRGERRFCVNPNYNGTQATLRGLVSEIQTVPDNHIVNQCLVDLAKIYPFNGSDWNPRELTDILSKLFKGLVSIGIDPETYIDRVYGASIAQTLNEADQFRSIEVLSCVFCSIIELVELDHVSEVYVKYLLQDLSDRTTIVIKDLFNDIKKNKYDILTNAGQAELFYLPIRLFKILGWCALSDLIQQALPKNDALEPKLNKLVQYFLANYNLSLISMSDIQSPYIACVMRMLSISDEKETGQELLELLFNSFIQCEGNVADSDISPDDVLNYLCLRAEGNLNRGIAEVAQPNLIGLTIMMFATEFDLGQVFDESLHYVDNVTLYLYMPEHLRDFASARIEHGLNLNFRIGADIWRVNELNSTLRPRIQHSAPKPLSFLIAIIISFIFPDRLVPLLLIED